jgi:dolichyl-diphosphooligosaccharide--protein glycosyltransferase
MKLTEALTRERVVTGLKSLGKLRIKIDHTSLITYSILLLILFIAFTVRIFPLRWELRKDVISLSEFDPYYQFRLTERMVTHGLLSPYWPEPWIDTQRWYRDGQNMAMSYPSLPMTAAILYIILSALGVNIGLMSFCAIFPAIFGTLACLVIYFVGKDIGGKSVGMLSALFLALSPSYIQRTSVGFFDDETIGMVALLLFIFLFLKAIEEDRPISSTVKYSLGAAATLAYFCSGWGASYYPIGLTVLFVFVLILLKRYSQRILLSYSITFGVGLFIVINVPYLSLTYLTSQVTMAIVGIFILLFIIEFLRVLTTTSSKVLFAIISLAVLAGGFAVLWQLGYMESVAGKFLSVVNPLIRAESPLFESVAEHRISAWGSIYYEFGIGLVFFVIGLVFTIRNPTNKNLFLLLFGLTSLYFASSMVRLLVILAPAYGLLASIGVFNVLKPFVTLLTEPPKIFAKTKYGLERVGKEFSGTAVFLIFIVLMTNLAFSPQTGGIPKVYGQADSPTTISAGSLPIAPNDPVQEWFDMFVWLKNNLGYKPESEKVVCSWWDYGYWLAIIGNVTSLADNATINSTQIENIGFIFMANETNALKMLKLYDAKYILVFTTFYAVQTNLGSPGKWIGFGDEGKWIWMARISGKAKERFKIGDTNNDGLSDMANLIDADSLWVDESKFGYYDNKTNQWAWNAFGMQSTIYKLMAWGKHEWCEAQLGSGQDPEINEWNNNGLSADDIKPKYFKQKYFAGLELKKDDASKYSYIVPLVCLYEIDWNQYYVDYPAY